MHDVAGDVVAAEGNGAEVANLTLVEHGKVGGSRPHFDERDTQLLLVLGEYGKRARERFEHQLTNAISCALYRLSQIERGRAADRHEIHLGLETCTDHADWIANAAVAINGVFLGNGVEQLAGRRNCWRV